MADFVSRDRACDLSTDERQFNRGDVEVKCTENTTHTDGSLKQDRYYDTKNFSAYIIRFISDRRFCANPVGYFADIVFQKRTCSTLKFIILSGFLVYALVLPYGCKQIIQIGSFAQGHCFRSSFSLSSSFTSSR